MKKIVSVFFTALLLAGCVNVKGPVNATSNVEASKSGTSCSHHLFYVFDWGDASIAKAKQNGNVTKVSSVDDSNKGFFPFIYHKSCTIVSGD